MSSKPASSAEERTAKSEDSNSVFYDIETSTGRKGIVVYEVNEVYVYIPAELSAAGFELKIAGTVRIIDKSDEFHLKWTPIDLTHQDVASLYSAQADGWTVVDQFVEPPVVIDSQELKYPSHDYHVKNLEMPEPILPSTEENRSQVKTPPNKQARSVKLTESGVHFSQDGDIHISGIVSSSANPPALTQNIPPNPKVDAVNFPLSKMHSVKQSHQRSLTFFLANGHELPTLHFHDGGTTGLIQALQRYTYLVRDASNPYLLRTAEYDKTKKLKSKAKPVTEVEDAQRDSPGNKRISKGLEVHDIIQGAVSGVVGNFVGITRAVRQHLLPDKQLLDVRPGTENDDDFDELLQTVTCSELNTGSPTSPTSPSEPPAQSTRKPVKPVELDPDASLITDFQIITDIRGKLPVRPKIQPRQPPVSVDEWERLRDDWGRISAKNEQKLRTRVFYGGLEPKLRKEAWKYLLNYLPFEVTDIERMELREKREKEYWVMKTQWQTISEAQEARFTKWRERKHLIVKDVLRTDRDLDLFKSPDSPKLVQLEDILKTYVMYNFDLGYVQGMSDLLAPLLAVMDNEVDAFWCFAGFMDMVEHHFEVTQAGMRTRLKQLRALLNVTDPELYQFLKEKDCNNLYFCFRWLLVNFKREFSYDDIMAMWEVIWTKYLSPDYSLFIALAILLREKEQINKESNDFSDILQHINRLSKSIPVAPVLEMAEVLCRQLGSCSSLPEDLQTVLVKPLPKRLSQDSIPKFTTDTIVCNPDSRAVPTQK